MVFVSSVLLISLLQKTPFHGAVFHASCAVAYACTANSVRDTQPACTLKGARGLRLKALPPTIGGNIAFAVGSICVFLITPPFLAAFPYLITCHLGLASHAHNNIPVMICSLLLGLAMSFGDVSVLLSAFSTLWSVLCHGTISHRATASAWWWCVAAHACMCVISCLFVPPNWKIVDCIIPALLGVLHVASKNEVTVFLTNTKKQIRRASHAALCLTFLVFPVYEIPKNRKMLVGGICTLCLASGSLWYYDFDSEWSRCLRPTRIAPSWLGVSLGVYALSMHFLGKWLLPQAASHLPLDFSPG